MQQFNQEAFQQTVNDIQRGADIITWGWGFLSQLAVCAIAASFSSVILAVIVWIIGTLLMFVLGNLVTTYAALVHANKVEALGAAAGKATAWATGLFSKKVSA